MAGAVGGLPPDAISEYRPRRWAVPLHQSFLRWLVLVLHRRAGKSTAVLHQHCRAAKDDAWEYSRLRWLARRDGYTLTKRQIHELMRNRQYGHILPTRTQAKLAAWTQLKAIGAFWGGVPNESELRIDFQGGHWVRLFGSDNPDSFRSAYFHGLSFDEFSQHPPNIFSESLSKALADHFGYAVFIGTIKGKNQLYKTYNEAKNDPNWFSLWQDINVSLATEEGATIIALKQAMHEDQQFIAKGLMSQEEYDQEWFLSTEAAIKGSYYGKQLAEARRDKRITRVPYDPALPVHDVWDLGKGLNMSVGMFQRYGREVRMIDYLEGQESDGIQHVIAELQRRPYVWGKHFAPHDIKATELTTGKTRLETAKSLGWEFDLVPDIGVDDGISAARMMLARTWIDEERCAPFIEALGQYHREWHDALGQFGDKPVHNWASHPADMYRYASVVEDKMRNERQKPPKPEPQKRPRPRFTGRPGPGGSLGWLR